MQNFLLAIGATVVAFILVVNVGTSDPPNPAAAAQEEKVKSDDDKFFHAAFACGKAVEDSVKYDLRWRVSSPSKRFPKYMGERDMINQIIIVGDEAEAQNGLGNWVRVNYMCTFNWKADKVLATRLDAGRL